MLDENAAGRRAWVGNLRRLLALTNPQERLDVVNDMSDRDWINEWMFCLRCVSAARVITLSLCLLHLTTAS